MPSCGRVARCSGCGEEESDGRAAFAFCEVCKRSWHPECRFPPLKDSSFCQGDWECWECSEKPTNSNKRSSDE